MNRWLFLGGSAVVGLLLYLVFKVSHTGQSDDSPRIGYNQVHDPGINGQTRWNTLSPPELPDPVAPSVSTGRSFGSSGRNSSFHATPEHPLDTNATVYLDGMGPAGSGTGGRPGGDASGADALILSALHGVLGSGTGGAGGSSSALSQAAKRIRSAAGGSELSNSGSQKIAAGNELEVVILKTVEGPSAQMPVMARIRSASLTRYHLPSGTKILGYPEGMSRDNRLRIRFYRILYPGGFEAHTTGFALSGGREGIPVRISRHMGENMAKSMAQNSMMIGGEAIGSMGWSGNDIGSFMAMQEGGNALSQVGSQVPVPNNQASYRLERGTPCEVMIMETFPIPAPKGEHG